MPAQKIDGRPCNRPPSTRLRRRCCHGSWPAPCLQAHLLLVPDEHSEGWGRTGRGACRQQGRLPTEIPPVSATFLPHTARPRVTGRRGRTDLPPQAGLVPPVWRLLQAEVLRVCGPGTATRAHVPQARTRGPKRWAGRWAARWPLSSRPPHPRLVPWLPRLPPALQLWSRVCHGASRWGRVRHRTRRRV